MLQSVVEVARGQGKYIIRGEVVYEFQLEHLHFNLRCAVRLIITMNDLKQFNLLVNFQVGRLLMVLYACCFV